MGWMHIYLNHLLSDDIYVFVSRFLLFLLYKRSSYKLSFICIFCSNAFVFGIRPQKWCNIPGVLSN